jgi:tetratricopeptide (TPR) repeat protein
MNHLDLLAYHYEHSTNDALAVLYLARHAEQLARLFANASAIRQYRAALARVTASSSVAPAELWRGLGDVYAQIAEFDQALASYDQALSLLPADAAAARFALQRRQIDQLVRATRFEAAWAASETARARLGNFHADPAQLALAEAQLAELSSIICMRQGRYGEAIKWAEQGQQRLAGQRGADPQRAVIRAKLYQALAAPSAMIGRVDLAQQAIGRAVRLIDSQQSPVLASELQLRLAILAMQRTQLRKATKLFARTMTLMEQIGARDRLAYTLLPGGEALMSCGRTAEALSWMERGMQLAAEVGTPFLVCAGHTLLTSLNTILGTWDAALAHCEQGLELARKHELHDRYIDLHVWKIEILLARGQYDQVEMLVNYTLSYISAHQLPHKYKFLCRIQAERYRVLGRAAEATRSMEEHSISFVPQLQSISNALADLGVAEWWALHMAQDPNSQPKLDASEVAERAHAALLFLRDKSVRLFLPYAYRMNGMVALARQQPIHAVQYLTAGLRIARVIQHLPETARLLICLGHVENNERISIRRLSTAAALFAQLGAQPEQQSIEQAIQNITSNHLI